MNLNSLSLYTAELFASPAATYNGKLIDESLKIVETAAKPEGYVYGAVSSDSLPILAIALVAVIGLAFLVPAFLSAGESAKVQQKKFENENKIGFNEFKDKKSPTSTIKNNKK
jgi:hypothetical protein